MPSSSQSQHDFMERCYKEKEFRDKYGVSKKVAKEFLDSDKKNNLWQKKKKKTTPQNTKPKKRISKESMPFFSDW